MLQNMNVLGDLKRVAIETNMCVAKELGIKRSSSVTCVKPSGNSSVMLDCSAGIHPRHAKYYIRRVRIDASSPIVEVLRRSGFDLSPENGQDKDNPNVWVVSFPVKSPKGATVKNDVTALEQLEWWKRVKLEWCEHNPSATISYDADELGDVVDWLFENQDIVGGLSFLPMFGAKYDQMPYEEITAKEYKAMVKATPKIDFSILSEIETQDMTTASQEIACVAGLCEL